MEYWGTSLLETPVVRYTRRWERWLAIVWPPRRKKLRMMQALLDANPIALQRAQNAITSALIFGSATLKH
jgi:hypothetical protein